MENPFIRAWRETKGSYGLTWGAAVRTILSVAAGLGLVWAVFGLPEAMNEGALYALYILAAIGAGFVPLFLWNLWLAPYRLMNEKIERSVRRTSSPDYWTPNVDHWAGTKTFKLGDAASLWVGVRPGNPIEDDRAAGKFAELSGAMMRGEIHYAPGGLRGLTNFLEGKRPWPEYSQPISAIALRRYADAKNDVPAFLQSVEVPPDPEPEPEDDKTIEKRESDDTGKPST